MSIELKNIYCSHWLTNVDKKIRKKYIRKSENYTRPHHLFLVKNTIHYNAVTSQNMDDYEHYITATNQYEHDVQTFETMIENFSTENMNKIELLYNDEINKYIVIDGVHRLVLLLHNNIIDDYISLDFVEVITQYLSSNDSSDENSDGKSVE
jgi:hypothetical protein